MVREMTISQQLMLLREARSARAISEVEYRNALRAMVEARWSIAFSSESSTFLPELVERFARVVATEMNNPASKEYR